MELARAISSVCSLARSAEEGVGGGLLPVPSPASGEGTMWYRPSEWVEACHTRRGLTKLCVNCYSPIAETHAVQMLSDIGDVTWTMTGQRCRALPA
jgi:hypothetical protein